MRQNTMQMGARLEEGDVAWAGLVSGLWETLEKGHFPIIPSQDFLLCIPRCPSSGWHWNLFLDVGSPIRVMCGATVCGGGGGLDE